MAIADVYDALISKRVYNVPFTHSKAVAIIKEGKGIHFDPAMVEAFVALQEEFRKIALQFADFEEERMALEQ
jgi:putative two-component system response regulator